MHKLKPEQLHDLCFHSEGPEHFRSRCALHVKVPFNVQDAYAETALTQPPGRHVAMESLKRQN